MVDATRHNINIELKSAHSHWTISCHRQKETSN